MTYQDSPAGPAYGAPPAKKSNKTLLIVLAVVGGLLLLCCVGGIIAVVVGGNEVKKKVTASHQVRFEVTSTEAGSVSVTYLAGTTTATLSDEALPFSKTITMKESFGIVSVNASAASGRMSCKLFVDGKEVNSNESDLMVDCVATVTP
ncbi:hypothetical protein Lfu02_32610 [Longispora fulva]|uniref:MmpS family membrane protein n=1 Tax=Longispora fulva TaxID=619741 RepID=A0A8J7GJP0_9ACTN|nr:MmpS family transport accessory protein [Longispora fulva]MBG6139391.1 hypothetical protein [Longispora fulva]GIG58889.1 hypothetical protein Lfu02_32610 [Longispora fulva]